MDLTIIIVNWNGGEMLQKCLESIRASRTTFGVKVIVVDNDSKDGSRETAQAQFPEFHVFNSGANLGFGRANNLARTMVTTPLVLILNPDTELRPDTLEITVGCLLKKPDVGALGCRMVYPNGQVQAQGLQWFPSPWTILLELLLVSRKTRSLFSRWLPAPDPSKSTYLSKLYGGYVLAHKHVLDKAGWFDDRYFMYAEDVDLSRTIIDQGSKLYYCAEAEVVHVSGGTSAKAPSGFSILMKNDSINKLMRKYHGPVGAFLHRLVVCVGSLARLLVLIPARIIPGLNSREQADERTASTAKQKLALLWALGIKRPFVANSR